MKRYIDFLETYDLGTFAFTLAGQALNAYCHRFMAHDIFIHVRKKAIALEREAYYGGRVEMYHREKLPPQTYTYVDINSAYPAVMRTKTYPVAFKGIQERVPVTRFARRLKRQLAIAEVVIKTERPIVPLRDEGRLIFPVGEFVTTLATPELLIALERGAIKEVITVAWYGRANIFRKYVDTLYELRQDAKKRKDALWDELLKRMMNSLYGKFGQHQFDWDTVSSDRDGYDRIWRELDRDTNKVETYRLIGGVLQRRTNVDEGYNSFVAIAAHATSYARVLLLSYIEQAGWSHTFYCDTDSLIVDEQGFAHLKHSIDTTKLGALKVEGQSRSVRLLAPKNYKFGEQVRHKGRRKNAKPMGHGAYQQEQFVSIVGAMRKGWQGGPLVKTIIKRDRLTYHKGIINDDNSITPLRLFRPG